MNLEMTDNRDSEINRSGQHEAPTGALLPDKVADEKSPLIDGKTYKQSWYSWFVLFFIILMSIAN